MSTSNMPRLLGKIHSADAGKFIGKLPDRSIDFVMTSPPYWGLRDYGVKGQIGLEKHPQEYIDKLVSLFSDLRRVLKPHGSLFLNLGDTYCSMKGSCVNAGGGKCSIPQPAYRQLARKKNPNRMLRQDGGWLQPKQLLMIPSRIAIAMQQDGWVLRNDIIWYKPNGLPSSVKDRLTNRYEHVFHFVKSRRYYYDLDAIRIPHKRGTPRAECDFQRMMRGRETFNGKWGKSGTQQAFIAGHIRGRNPGDVVLSRKKTAQLGKLSSMRNPPEPNEAQAFHPLGKNPGDLVEISGQIYPEGQSPEYSYGSRCGKWSGQQKCKVVNSFACWKADKPRTINAKGGNPGDIYTGEQEELDYWKQVLLEQYAQIGRTARRSRSGKYKFIEEYSSVSSATLNSSHMREAIYGMIEGLPTSEVTKQTLKDWWHDHNGHWQGPNPGDFWKISTRPFPEAHFAVYPEDLCVRPIVSSCPPAVCRACGKAPVPVSRQRGARSSADWRERARTMDMPLEDPVAHLAGGHTGLLTKQSKQYSVSWCSCGCNADFEPGIVFDPFAGTGTTLLVAKKLARQWLGCELNPKYVKIAEARLRPFAERKQKGGEALYADKCAKRR